MAKGKGTKVHSTALRSTKNGAAKIRASEIYLRAAERIASDVDEYSCIAITSASDPRYGLNAAGSCFDNKHAQRFVKTFADGASRLQDSFERWNDGQSPRELRVLALCFMAAIAGSHR